MTTSRQGIAAKLAKAGEACRYIQKDKRNGAQNYSYVSDQAVASKAMSALAAEGIAVVHTEASVLQHAEVPMRNGGSARYVLVSVRIRLSDGEAEVAFEGLGSGMDSGDKAVMKAMTAARKYALLVGLGIASGDDPEADERVDEAARAPAQEAKPAPRPAPVKPQAAKAPPSTVDGNAEWGIEPAAQAVTAQQVVEALAACDASVAELRAWYTKYRDVVRSWKDPKERVLVKSMLQSKCQEVGVDIKVVTS